MRILKIVFAERNDDCMSTEKMKISQEQSKNISKMLQESGFSEKEIYNILNEEYEMYNSVNDVKNALGEIKKYSEILEILSSGYLIEELQSQGIVKLKIQEFKDMLNQKKLTVDGARAIYQYSVGSNMILGVQRGVSKATIKSQIIIDLEKALASRGISPKGIDEMKKIIEELDYNSALYENYDIANKYMEKLGINKNSRVSVRSAIQSIDRLTHIDDTICSLEKGLESTALERPMKLYRAVKKRYLENKLKNGEKISDLVGRALNNEGQTSTSPLYDSSFAILDDYDAVFEIYIPKGSRGTYIAELSAYDNAEQEVLLNSNTLYITDVKEKIVDKNGKIKIVLQALCLSNDIECYKEIYDKVDEKIFPLIKKENIFSRIMKNFRKRKASPSKSTVKEQNIVTEKTNRENFLSTIRGCSRAEYEDKCKMASADLENKKTRSQNQNEKQSENEFDK